MYTRHAAILLALACAAIMPAWAQVGLPTRSRNIDNQILASGPVQLDLKDYFGAPGVTGQVVQFVTSSGRVNVELRASEAPRNVANFLSYLSRNAYDSTFIHRVDPLTGQVPAVVHGGGYQLGTFAPTPPTVTRSAPVALEYVLPNVRGTLAAYHAPGDPNGATSEWFFNTIDNTETFGPASGGYTVIGRVLGTGMTVVDAIAQTPTASFTTGFERVPLRNYTPPATVTLGNLVAVTSVRAIPIYPPTQGDPTALLSFTATSGTPSVVAVSIVGSSLRLTPLTPGTATIAVQATDANGNVSAAATFTVSVPADALLAPIFTAQPTSLEVAVGSTVVLNAVASGGNVFFPITYHWMRDGVTLPDTDSPHLILRAVSTADVGTYSCVASNAVGSTLSSAATLSVVATSATEQGRLINLAIRTTAGTGDDTLIVGFGVSGPSPATTKPLLVRAVGPSLGQFGLEELLADPVIALYQGRTVVAQNDNWGGTAQILSRARQVGAFSLVANDSLDAALALSSAPGSYTMQVSGKNQSTGTVLAEVYDASETVDDTSPRLVNVSARGFVGTGGNILVAGFVIGGTTPATVLIRAIGPTLTHFGIPGAMTDTKLQLFRGPTSIRENDDWGGDFKLDVVAYYAGAFSIAEKNSKDSVLLVTLPPGTYSAQVSGANGGTGVGMVEIYEVR